MQALFRWLGAAAILLTALCTNQAQADMKSSVVLSINEGTSGSSDFLTMQDKYRPLADYLTRKIKLQVKLESATTLKLVLIGLEKHHFELLLVRPSHIAAKAMRDYHYQLAAAADGQSTAYFIIKPDSTLKSLKDLKGKRIAMPDPDAYPTHIGLAMLKQAGVPIGPDTVAYSRSQEAVGYAVKQGFVAAGVVISYSKVFKNWEKEGGRVLTASPALPFWGILAHPDMPPALLAQIRQALIDLKDTDEGKAILHGMGISGFVAGDPNSYANMLKFLGE